MLECPLYSSIKEKFQTSSLLQNVERGTFKSFYQLDYQGWLLVIISQIHPMHFVALLAFHTPSWCTSSAISTLSSWTWKSISFHFIKPPIKDVDACVIEDFHNTNICPLMRRNIDGIASPCMHGSYCISHSYVWEPRGYFKLRYGHALWEGHLNWTQSRTNFHFTFRI